MNNFNIQRARNTVKCADGFQMSVQASEHHYCSPKASGWNTQYTSVEIGFPTEKVEDLMRYIDEEESDPTNTVYTYVPAVIVCKIIPMYNARFDLKTVTHLSNPLFPILYKSHTIVVYFRHLTQVHTVSQYGFLCEARIIYMVMNSTILP